MTEDKPDKPNTAPETLTETDSAAPHGSSLPKSSLIIPFHKSTIHLGRIDGKIQVLSKESGEPLEILQPGQELVRVMFSYLSPKGVSIYSKIPLEKHSTVLLSLAEPSHMDLKAKVFSCSDKSNTGSVVSSQKFPYKIMLKFEIDKPEITEKLKAYIQELNRLFNDS